MSAAIWSELDIQPAEAFTARKPWISSFRRNLRREHSERLAEHTLPGTGSVAAYKPISNLARGRLRDLRERIQKVIGDRKPFVDPYTLAHLTGPGGSSQPASPGLRVTG